MITRNRFLSLLLLLLGLLAASRATTVAQTTDYAYWQYDTAGRLDFSVVADVDNDGVDEFLLAIENDTAVLLDSDGSKRWDVVTDEPIHQLAALDFNGPDEPGGVVIATRNHLTLIGENGRQVWQQRIEAPTGAPPAPVVLLTAEDEAAWQSQRAASPVALVPVDYDGDGRQELAVALKSGLLQLFSSQGDLLWEYPQRDDFPDDARAQLAIEDLNRDGRPDIIFGYYLPRRNNRGGLSKLALLEADGQLQWELSVVGRMTGMTLVEFQPDGRLEIAVSTQLGRQNRVYLYDADGAKVWHRTPNRPVTSMAMGRLSSGPALVVGTEVGTLIAFDAIGRRLWERVYTYSGQPDRQVAAISATPYEAGGDQPVALAVTLATRDDQEPEATDVLLLDRAGCLVRATDAAAQTLTPGANCLTDPTIYPPVPAVGLGRLVDINHDLRDELLLTRFGTLELIDPGIGVPQYTASERWGGYRLEARPQALLVADIDGDGENELLAGGDDGRLHVVQSNGQARWREDMGGAITFLALAPSATAESLPTIVVVHNRGEPSPTSQIELLGADRQRLWPEPLTFDTAVTSLLVGDADGEGGPEIIVGTADGAVVVYSLTGVVLNRMPIPGRIVDVALLEGTPDGRRRPQIYVAVGDDAIYQFEIDDQEPLPTTTFSEPIDRIFTIAQERELATHLLAELTDGTLYGLNWRGIPLWQERADYPPTHILAAGNLLYIADEAGGLTTIDVAASNPYNNSESTRPEEQGLVIDADIPQPRLSGLGDVTDIHHGYLDRDTLLDLAIGNQQGEVKLFAGDGRFLGQFELVTGVFGITALSSQVLQTDELLVVADNGVIQLYQARENRPPLLINPRATVEPGGYDVAVDIIDIESSDVVVALQTWDPALGDGGDWRDQGQQTAAGGRGTLAWAVSVAGLEGPVRYRFLYDDGSHNGVVEPTPGAPPIPAGGLLDLGPLVVVLLVAVAAAAVAFVRQANSPGMRTRRFYNRLSQQPAASLSLLEAEYARTGGSPDFLLSLANRARRERNRPLAGLADGLFLLADRPEAALPIIAGALAEAARAESGWQRLALWQQMIRTYQALLTAPSITELSLLRPLLVELIAQQEAAGRPASTAQSLLAPLTSLRDSERVDLADDRFVYLHEAGVLLRQLRERMPNQAFSLENQLGRAVVRRWLGLVNAAIDELRGQAQLVINLKTTRLVPEPETIVALELRNTGRAAAENVVVAVAPDPAYEAAGPAQTIPFLAPGRSRTVQLAIAPLVNDRFRLAFEIGYDDRQRPSHRLAFADMVHLLPPVREFRPVINPYAPGVPLRRNSTLFYGREGLFQFIAANAGQLSQQNVLILVGQRRSGKTSALLRLEHYLPETLVPIYIDCQSLGVLPGMAAFFHDLAWLISDALVGRGVDVEVPNPQEWQDDPAGRFQRQFIPTVQALLPAGTTLLLVFDEFEAFENLVNDGILPPTLFTFLRHMMQHSDQLSFVFVGTRRLEEMSTDYWSVLFNIALYRQIGFLDEAAATRLIAEPVAPNIVYDDLAIDKILRVTAGHPYFLQLVCYALVNRANEQRTTYVTISDVNAALTEMLRLGEVHFAYIWRRSTQPERALLTAVAHLMERDPLFHPADLVQYLAQYGIRLDPAEVTAGLNRLVEREILREVADEATTLYELKIGLVGLWVAQNKSLSKLYESSNGEGRARRPVISKQ